MKVFSYDDICLRPNYSELTSRSNADTFVNFLGRKYQLPVIPANMQDVISWKLADFLQANNYFYIMHRFGDANINISEKIKCEFLSISLGVNEASKKEYEDLIKNKYSYPDVVTIDVAHGHHKKVEEMIKWLNVNNPKKSYIIAGNVATADGYKFLCDLGVDAVKVGIGGGSICETKNKTGFHLPTAYSIWDCVENTGGKYDVPIIADGGARNFGDIAKALTLGAKMVMSGSWFASCIDSPAKIQNGKKIYRGSTSYEAKGQKKHIEGRTLELLEGVTYLERLEEIRQALCSSISYAGGTDLAAFNRVKWDLL